MSTRRDFLVQGATALGAAGSILPVMAACAARGGEVLEPDEGGSVELDLSKYPELAAVGGSARVTFGDGPVLVVYGSDDAAAPGGGYLALSAKCTHMGCKVDFDDKSDEIRCPCHGSRFSQDGSVLEGPAKQPLRSYSVERVANNDRVTLRIR